MERMVTFFFALRSPVVLGRFCDFEALRNVLSLEILAVSSNCSRGFSIPSRGLTEGSSGSHSRRRSWANEVDNSRLIPWASGSWEVFHSCPEQTDQTFPV